MNSDRLYVIAMIRFRIFETFLFQAPRLQAEVHRGRVEEAARRGRCNTLTSIFVTIKSKYHKNNEDPFNIFINIFYSTAFRIKTKVVILKITLTNNLRTNR